jgi:2-succinyl-5-enolpyruvyl-6-hydroxy-3-cyclohexene-1-carboxylate synthase
MFVVPHGLELTALASGLGWDAVRASSAGSFAQALSRSLQGGRHVIEVPVDRAANTAFHGSLSEAVCTGLRREPLP